MNFQGLKTVENDKFYIDLAFRKATEESSRLRGSKKLRGSRIDRSVKIEMVKIDAIKDVLTDKMHSLIKSFPDLESLPDFYLQLVKCTIDYAAFKKSLGSLNWAKNKVIELHEGYIRKIRKCKELSKINDYRREFYGRVSSVMKQIKDNLRFLEEARKIMKQYPAIKTGMKTVAIAGFPNVGKTTLLFKMTGSKPDIQPYAFTTQGVNVAYISDEGQRVVQLLDTPGTLNRFDKMNYIERIASIAIELLAEKIIYVFDLTEPYPLEEQVKLYESLKKLKKPVLIYLSKTDIIEKENAEEFSKKYKILTPEQIKMLLLKP